jgi:hypothetical protein
VEARSGRSVFIGGEGTACEKQAEANHEVRGKAHSGGIIAQQSSPSETFLMPKTISGIAAQMKRIGCARTFLFTVFFWFCRKFLSLPVMRQWSSG